MLFTDADMNIHINSLLKNNKSVLIITEFNWLAIIMGEYRRIE